MFSVPHLCILATRGRGEEESVGNTRRIDLHGRGKENLPMERRIHGRGERVFWRQFHSVNVYADLFFRVHEVGVMKRGDVTRVLAD